MHALPALLGPTASRGMESRRPPASRHQGKSGNLQSGSLSGSSQPQAAERRRPWLGSEMDRRGESESVSTQRPRKRLPVHANAGSSEQLAAASEPERRAPSCRVWNRRFWNILRALTKYVSQRALPPGAPALATHGLNVRCKKTNRAPQRTYRVLQSWFPFRDYTVVPHDSGTITASGEAITRRGRARWLPRYRCHR